MLKIVVAVGIAVGLLAVMGILINRQKKRTELLELAQKKQRDIALEEAIRNQRIGSQKGKISSVPYELDYSKSSDPARQKKIPAGGSGHLMVQIEEHSDLSVRKFMLDPSDDIYIGRETDVNTIVISDQAADARHCLIFESQGCVYIKSLTEFGHTQIIRKSKTTQANQQGIRLLTGDRLQIGKIYFDITLIGQDGKIR